MFAPLRPSGLMGEGHIPTMALQCPLHIMLQWPGPSTPTRCRGPTSTAVRERTPAPCWRGMKHAWELQGRRGKNVESMRRGGERMRGEGEGRGKEGEREIVSIYSLYLHIHLYAFMYPYIPSYTPNTCIYLHIPPYTSKYRIIRR